MSWKTWLIWCIICPFQNWQENVCHEIPMKPLGYKMIFQDALKARLNSDGNEACHRYNCCRWWLESHCNPIFSIIFIQNLSLMLCTPIFSCICPPTTMLIGFFFLFLLLIYYSKRLLFLWWETEGFECNITIWVKFWGDLMKLIWIFTPIWRN